MFSSLTHSFIHSLIWQTFIKSYSVPDPAMIKTDGVAALLEFTSSKGRQTAHRQKAHCIPRLRREGSGRVLSAWLVREGLDEKVISEGRPGWGGEGSLAHSQGKRAPGRGNRMCQGLRQTEPGREREPIGSCPGSRCCRSAQSGRSTNKFARNTGRGKLLHWVQIWILCFLAAWTGRWNKLDSTLLEEKSFSQSELLLSSASQRCHWTK